MILASRAASLPGDSFANQMHFYKCAPPPVESCAKMMSFVTWFITESISISRSSMTCFSSNVLLSTMVSFLLDFVAAVGFFLGGILSVGETPEIQKVAIS